MAWRGRRGHGWRGMDACNGRGGGAGEACDDMAGGEGDAGSSMLAGDAGEFEPLGDAGAGLVESEST